MIRRVFACLCLMLLPLSATAAELSLTLAGQSRNIIVTEVDAMARVQLTGVEKATVSLVTARFDGHGNWGIVNLSEQFEVTAGQSMLPKGIIIIGAGTIGLFPSRNVQGVYPSRTLKLATSNGQISANHEKALVAAIQDAAKNLSGNDAGVLAVILPDGTEMITKGIILIGE